MNLHLNDPGVPGPGELQMSPGLRHSMTWGGSPRHERTPSLGELHQELESEQEGQVVRYSSASLAASPKPAAIDPVANSGSQNRLLSMIRAQQAQIAALQSSQPSSSAAVVDDSTPTSERSLSFPSHAPHPAPAHPATAVPIPRTRSPAPYAPSRNPSQQHTSISRTSSHASNSPALHPLHPHSSHGGEDFLLGLPAARDRDDAAYYQAETQSLVRENQMLKLRIRELERLVGEMNTASGGGGQGGVGGHEPGRSSNLVSAPVESSEGGSGAGAEGREGGGGE